MLEKAALLPRTRITHAAKLGTKVALLKTKEILNSTTDNYKMKFKDGNTWEKKDIIKNLKVKLEKGQRKQKRIAQVTIKDWRVSLYANFPEFGYTNPRTKEVHKGLHFMRDGLTLSRKQVEQTMLEDLAKSLDNIK